VNVTMEMRRQARGGEDRKRKALWSFDCLRHPLPVAEVFAPLGERITRALSDMTRPDFDMPQAGRRRGHS